MQENLYINKIKNYTNNPKDDINNNRYLIRNWKIVDSDNHCQVLVHKMPIFTTAESSKAMKGIFFCLKNISISLLLDQCK